MIELIYAAELCPECGSRVTMLRDCPGWEATDCHGKRRVMTCSPACGKAVHLECTNCSWWLREPNNRERERFDTRDRRWVGMGPMPAWVKRYVGDTTPGEGIGE